eukprot:jgi/Tetstr1/448661/TSEL_035904.t1
MAAVVNFMFFTGRFTSVLCRVRGVHVDSYNITMHVYREKGRAGRRGPDDLRVLLLPVPEHPRVGRLMPHFIDNIQSATLAIAALAETGFSTVAAPCEQSKSWLARSRADRPNFLRR